MQITDEVQTGKVVLTLSGRMDFQARHAFHTAMDKARLTHSNLIILNFSQVPFIDSAGLGLLMLAHKSVQESKTRFTLEVSPGYVADVLSLGSIGQTIPISVLTPHAITAKPRMGVVSSKAGPKPSPVFESLDVEQLLLPILERLERKDFHLPTLPQVASQVLALTTDPNAQSSKLTALIQQDPILTAKIFKTANSVACGTTREIGSLSQAVAWLGLNTIAGTAFALSVQSGIFNGRGYEREVRALWAHAIATAYYGKALAGMIGQDPDTSFLSGLLHGIGKPFVVHTVNQYRSSADIPLPWTAMLTLFEQSYIEVGRQLADEWNFPLAVKEAINLHQHHSYHLATHPSKSAAITCLARHLATYHLDSVSVSEDTIRALPAAAALNIPPEVMDGLLEMKDLIQIHIDSLLL